MKLYTWHSIVISDDILEDARDWSETDHAKPTGQLAVSFEACQKAAVDDYMLSLEDIEGEVYNQVMATIAAGNFSWEYNTTELVWEYSVDGLVVLYMGVREFEITTIVENNALGRHG